MNIQQHTPAILRCTKEPTPVKNLTDAQFVNFPPLDFCTTLISLQYKKSTTFLAKIYEKEPLWVVSWKEVHPPRGRADIPPAGWVDLTHRAVGLPSGWTW